MIKSTASFPRVSEVCFESQKAMMEVEVLVPQNEEISNIALK